MNLGLVVMSLSLLTYIAIMNDVTMDQANQILDQCLISLSAQFGMDRSRLVLMLQSRFPSYQAKLNRTDVYDTLMICNNNTEAGTTEMEGFHHSQQTKVRDLSHLGHTIYLDEPSRGRKVDLHGRLGSPRIDAILNGRTFQYIVAGMCPWVIYMDRDGTPIPKFIQHIKKHLNLYGYWIIYSYRGQHEETTYRDRFAQDMTMHGFTQVPASAIPFLGQSVKDSVLVLQYTG